jgi:hypothetical protein
MDDTSVVQPTLEKELHVDADAFTLMRLHVDVKLDALAWTQ